MWELGLLETRLFKIIKKIISRKYVLFIGLGINALLVLASEIRPWPACLVKISSMSQTLLRVVEMCTPIQSTSSSCNTTVLQMKFLSS